MNLQKVKSLLLFLVLAALFFYFGHAVAREPGSAVVQSEQSTRFFDIIAVLDSIQFDFDFINSLSDTAINTDTYDPSLSSPDSGRDNPFMRSDVSTPFSGLSGVSTGVAEFADSRAVREEFSEPLSETVFQQPLEGVVPPQDSDLVSPEDPSPEQQEDQPVSPPSPPLPVSPPPSPSATLTR